MILLLSFPGIFENYEIISKLLKDYDQNMQVHIFLPFNNSFLPFRESKITDSFSTTRFKPIN